MPADIEVFPGYSPWQVGDECRLAHTFLEAEHCTHTSTGKLCVPADIDVFAGDSDIDWFIHMIPSGKVYQHCYCVCVRAHH